jgi:NADH:ubiquinone oxidoreductase subunit F (NADH-binding)
MSETFQPVLLRRCNGAGPVSLDAYMADGGYVGLKNALAKKPEEVTQVVQDSVLRGRGGAGFHTGLTRANRGLSTTESWLNKIRIKYSKES